MKKLLNIYNAFKYDNLMNDKENLNDIVKRTKSVLANKIKFNDYINNYSKTTERYTFKTPHITEYPIFNKKSSILIPLKTKKIKYYEDFKSTIDNKHSGYSQKKIIIIPKESSYKKKIIKNIKIQKNLFKNRLNKLLTLKNINKKERYNSLFLDFFYKWNNDISSRVYSNHIDIFDKTKAISPREYTDYERTENKTNRNKNGKYSELNYNDNIIFNQDYSHFINDKIQYIKNNNIENKQKFLKSSFKDANGKEITLKLESIKIIFEQINEINTLLNNNDINDNNTSKNKQELFIPLYYAFLFLYTNIEVFKYILVSTLIFSNDFETITFNDKLIIAALNAINKLNEIGEKKDYKYDSKKYMKNNSKLFTSSESHIRKMPTKNYGSFSTNFAKNKLNNNNTRNEVRDSIGNILEAL
jgi:hypothetical protein